MKAVALGVVLLVAVAGAATGAWVLLRDDGGDGEGRDPYAAALADLCVQARGEIEALGRPSETPIDVVYAGTVRIGRELLAQTRDLTPPEEKKARVAVFAHQYGLYLDGLEYAYHYLENQGNQVAFVQIVNGALANLRNAERVAKELGAPECAVRPFE
jgi:hypothetical protein